MVCGGNTMIEKKALRILGKIAEIDLKFQSGKIDEKEAWDLIHEELQKGKN